MRVGQHAAETEEAEPRQGSEAQEVEVREDGQGESVVRRCKLTAQHTTCVKKYAVRGLVVQPMAGQILTFLVTGNEKKFSPTIPLTYRTTQRFFGSLVSS